MDKERMAELEKIESHGAENGWVAPMTEEDREFFSYLAMVALISLFQKILHCAAKDFGKAENRFRAGFIDILVALFVHLN